MSERSWPAGVTATSIEPRRLTLLSLSVTAACLPLYVVRWHIGPLPTTLLEALILLTAFLYLLTLWREHRLPAARTPYDFPIVLLLVAGIIGIAVAPDHVKAIGIYRAYFIEAVAMFYIAIDTIRTRDDVRTFLAVAAVGACGMAVGQIVSFVYVFAHHRLELGDAPAFLNTTPNAVAMYLEPPIAFAAAFAVFPSRPRERWVGISVLTLLLCADVLTLSRASYSSLLVLAVVFVISLQSARLRAWLIGGIAVVALILVEVPFINQRLVTLGYSVALRESIYNQAIRMLSQRPILGAGIDGFPIRVAPFRPPTQTIQLYPHDVWLTTWSEIGLLGVVAFAIIFFGLLVRSALALPKPVDVFRPLLWGAFGALVLYTVHGLVDSPYWKNDLSVEFWLLAALQFVAVRSMRATAGADAATTPERVELSTGDQPRL